MAVAQNNDTWAQTCVVAIVQVDDSQRFSADPLSYDHEVRTIVCLLVPSRCGCMCMASEAWMVFCFCIAGARPCVTDHGGQGP